MLIFVVRRLGTMVLTMVVVSILLFLVLEINVDKSPWIDPETAAGQDFAPSRDDCPERLKESIAAG